MEISPTPPPSHRCTEAPPKFWGRCTKKKRKKSKKYDTNSSSESSSEDECAKAAMLAELRRKRLLREQKERVKADELRNRHRGLFKH